MAPPTASALCRGQRSCSFPHLFRSGPAGRGSGLCLGSSGTLSCHLHSVSLPGAQAGRDEHNTCCPVTLKPEMETRGWLWLHTWGGGRKEGREREGAACKAWSAWAWGC